MKIAVTGATGFVGQYVVQELIRQNINVIAISRHKSSLWQDNKLVKTICLDIDNYDPNVFEHIECPKTLIHLAWPGLQDYNSTIHTETVPKHLRFLTSCIESGLKQLIVIGTCLEYGVQDGELNESSPIKPSTAYGIAKNKLRIGLETLQQQNYFELSWLRLFYLYGIGQSEKSLYSQLSKVVESGGAEFKMSQGDQTRDFIAVENVACLIITIAKKNKGEGIINICSGLPVSVETMVRKWLFLKNANIKLNLGFFPYPEYEARHFWGARNKLNSILEQK